MKTFLSLVAIGTIAVTTTASGQRVDATPTVERFSFDVVAGSGARTAQSGDVWFGGAGRESFAQLSGAIRLGSEARVRGVLIAEYAIDLRGDQVALCGIAPNGSCYGYFPRTSGPALSLGIGVAASRRLNLRIGAGASGSSDIMPFVSVKVESHLSEHFGAVAEVRRLSWHDSNDRWLWYQPIGVGVRIH